MEQACYARLDVFTLPTIQNYQTILYLDTDIIITQPIQPLFDQATCYCMRVRKGKSPTVYGVLPCLATKYRCTKIPPPFRRESYSFETATPCIPCSRTSEKIRFAENPYKTWFLTNPTLSTMHSNTTYMTTKPSRTSSPPATMLMISPEKP